MEKSTKNPSFSASLHNVEWERIQLKLEGLVEGNTNDQFNFYFINRETKCLLPVLKSNVEGHTFNLVINISTVNKGDRIPDGKWDLIITNNEKKQARVKLASNLTYNGNEGFSNQYSRDFKSGPKRLYQVHTEVNEKDNGVCLNVLFKHPKPKKKKITLKRVTTKFRMKIFDFVFYMAKRLVKKNGKRILFTSASRSEIGGNLGAVYNRMIERGLDKEYTIKKIFKSNIWTRSNWLDKFRLPFTLGISDFILIEDYQPMVNKMNYDDGTEVIQLWHANGAFKTFGYSRLGKPASPLIDGANHRIYTKAITSSKHVIPYYAEAFAIDESKVVATGIPKTDLFFDDEYKRITKEKILNVYPQIKDAEKVILFGPTFRGGGPKTAFYPMHKIEYERLAELCREMKAIVIFKMHFLVKNKLEIPEEFSDVFIDATDYREINDILFVADVLITDYSSTVYEYSLLDKPMLFYAFDLEEYISSRDFYDDFEDFVPGKIVKTFDELLRSLKEEDYEFEKVELFRNKNFEFQDDGASDRVIDWLILNRAKLK